MQNLRKGIGKLRRERVELHRDEDDTDDIPGDERDGNDHTHYIPSDLSS